MGECFFFHVLVKFILFLNWNESQILQSWPEERQEEEVEEK